MSYFKNMDIGYFFKTIKNKFKTTNFVNSNKIYSKYYKFDYMEESVKKWKVQHITKDMINRLPFAISPLLNMDYYGEYITDVDEWLEQRQNFVDYLYRKYKR